MAPMVEGGFPPLLSGKRIGAIHGDGTYFARDAKYSDPNYVRHLRAGTPAKPDGRTFPHDTKQILLVKVALGRWEKGVKDVGVLSTVPGQPKHVTYDSRVNDTQTPTIFVVPRSSHAYPAYVITYHG